MTVTDTALREIVFRELDRLVDTSGFKLSVWTVDAIVDDLIAHNPACEEYIDREIRPHVEAWKELHP